FRSVHDRKAGCAAGNVFLGLMIGATRIDVIDALDDRPAGTGVAFHGRGADIEPRLLEAEIRAAWRLWRVSTTLDDRLPPDFQPLRPVHRRETACADGCRFHLLSFASKH